MFYFLSSALLFSFVTAKNTTVIPTFRKFPNFEKRERHSPTYRYQRPLVSRKKHSEKKPTKNTTTLLLSSFFSSSLSPTSKDSNPNTPIIIITSLLWQHSLRESCWSSSTASTLAWNRRASTGARSCRSPTSSPPTSTRRIWSPNRASTSKSPTPLTLSTRVFPPTKTTSFSATRCSSASSSTSIAWSRARRFPFSAAPSPSPEDTLSWARPSP